MPEEISSFDIDDGRMIVGIRNGGDSSPALIQIYGQQGPDWVLEYELDVIPEAGINTFSVDVAIDGDLAVASVRASHPDADDHQGSRLYALRYEGGTWAVEDEFIDILNPDYKFSYRPALEGEVLLVTSSVPVAGGVEGAVQVFRRISDGWVAEEVIMSPVPREGSFAYSLVYDGERLVISEPGTPGNGQPPGRVYVFRHEMGTWAVEAELEHGEESDIFGRQLALLGDRLAVGARLADGDRGLVVAYDYREGAWQRRTVLPRQGTSGSPFPEALELGASYLFASQFASGLSGTRVLEYSDTTLVEVGRLVPPSGPVGSMLVYYDGLLYTASGSHNQIWIFEPDAILRPPSLTAPMDAAAIPDTQTQLRWERPPGAISFDLQVSTQPGVTGVLMVDESGLPGTSYDLTGLDLSTTYYWRVRAVDVTQTSIWSDVWSFSTPEGVPPAPVQVYPVNRTDVSIPTTFLWKRVLFADEYDLQVSRDSLFGSIDLDAVIPQGSADTLGTSLDGLAFSTTYYWRIRGRNAGATGDWSNVARFTTRPATPVAPVLALPENGAEEPGPLVALRWHPAALADTYRLQVAYTSAFTDVLRDVTTPDTVRFVGELTVGRVHYWRVRSQGAGTSPWSEVRYFITVLPTDREEATGPPAMFALRPPSPNPFSASTRIGFDVAEATTVRVEVFDLLGRSVAVLANREMPPGRYEVSWEPGRLASGVYFVRMHSPSFSEARRMLVQR